MFLIFFQSRQFIHVDNCRRSGAAFDAETDESLCLHLFEEIDVFAFPVDDNGRQNHQTGSFRHGQNRIDHLRDGLGGQGIFGMFWAVRCADACKKQTQIVIYFRDGADGRPGIVRGRFLVNGDGRRKPFDQIHIRFFHKLQKLAGVGRERFDITALSLRIKGVESKRGLPGTGKSGDDDQLVAWQIDLDVFQIVCACTANNDFFLVFRHGECCFVNEK